MRHRLGTLLLVIGVGVLAWAATVWVWKDPFTAAYTAYEQRRLEANLDRQFESWALTREPVSRPGCPALRTGSRAPPERAAMGLQDS